MLGSAEFIQIRIMNSRDIYKISPEVLLVHLAFHVKEFLRNQVTCLYQMNLSTLDVMGKTMNLLENKSKRKLFLSSAIAVCKMHRQGVMLTLDH